MRHGTSGYLRAVTLLAALGIGILGQLVATVAMAMPMQMPQDAPQDAGVLSSSTTDVGGCPWCLPREGGPAFPATTASGCITLPFCSISPAVLPTGAIVVSLARASFEPAAFQRDAGITVRPDLGPPRSIPHT